MRNQFPVCLGTHKDVVANFDIGVAVYAPQRHPVNLTVVDTAKS